MGNFIKTQTSFSHGEVSPNFYFSDEIHGLSHLENMDVIFGGIKRRPGLKKVAKVPKKGRLVSFSVAEGQDYVLVLMDTRIRIFLNDTFVQELISPWNFADLSLLQYAQRFGTMIFVHPDYCPKVLSFDNGTFSFHDFKFSSSSDYGKVYIPYMRFEDAENITITASYQADGVHFITNYDFWTPDNVGGLLKLFDKTWIIDSYIGPQDVLVIANGSYTLDQNPHTDWQEAAFSPRRGWPISITFHQNRLVFGGARSCPGGVWISCVGDHGNFNLGSGLDDEAIYFILMSDVRQHICTVTANNNLHILTSQGEWSVSSKPLTPETVDVKMETTVGSLSSRYLPPQKIEDEIIFVSGNRKDIRELKLDELGEKYKANNICALSEHLIDTPMDVAYNKDEKRLYVVMRDGTMSVFNRDVSQDIAAWGRYTTDGEFLSVAVSGHDTFVLTMRNTDYYLERFSDSELMDCDNHTYTVSAAGLPIRASGHNTNHLRIKKITVHLWKSKTLFINNTRIALPNETYSDNSDGFSGEVSANIIGTNKDFTVYPWQISSSDTLPLTVLSVTIHGRYQI